MTARIEDRFMTAEFGGRVVASARYSPGTETDGRGAWVVQGLPRRLCSRTCGCSRCLTPAMRISLAGADGELTHVTTAAFPAMVAGWPSKMRRGGRGALPSLA